MPDHHSRLRIFENSVLHFSRYLILACLITISGCTGSSLFVVNTLAGFADFNVVEDVPYGQHELNRLDIYIPRHLSEDSTAFPPTVIFFYGGCWGGCETRNKEDYPFVAQALTSHGYAAVLADYRRHPQVKFPEIMDDARQVVEWTKDNIEAYGGSAEKIFLMGHSAGAHLAVMLNLNESYLQKETYRSLKGSVGLAGPYDFLPLTKRYQKEVFGPPEKYPESQPVNFVEGTEPPLLLLYGNEDETVKPRNIVSLTRRILLSGGEVEYHIYDNIDHITILGALSIPLQNSEPVLKDIINFLNRQSSREEAFVINRPSPLDH